MEDAGQTIILRSGVNEVVDELSCKSHEEADSKIFAHLAYCHQTLGQTRAIIHATDVNIIMLSSQHLLSLEGLQEIWIQMNDKCMHLHDLLTLLSIKYDTDHKEMSDALLATYVLSGKLPIQRWSEKGCSDCLAHDY